MDMQMHMIGAMYAPSDKLTLMGMLMYSRNTMDGTMKMDSMGEGMQMPKMMQHSMESDGLGDLRLSGLYQIADLGHARIHLNLGVSVPTGSTDEKNNGMLLAYPMQLGSGTWDMLPGVTYNAQNEDLSWGAQLTGTFARETTTAIRWDMPVERKLGSLKTGHQPLVLHCVSTTRFGAASMAKTRVYLWLK